MRLINSYGGTVPYGTSSNSYYSNYGGYYNNYNPYYYMQQRQEEERRRQQAIQEQKEQEEVFDILNRAASKSLGREIKTVRQPNIEEAQNDWYKQQQYISEIYQYNHLANNIHKRMDVKNYTSYGKELLDTHMNKVYEEMKMIRKPKSLYEFLENSGSIRMELEEQERNRISLTQAYNGEDYRQLLNLHNQSYDSLSPRYTIDDMEISLPDRFKGSQAYREAKAKFLNAILPL